MVDFILVISRNETEDQTIEEKFPDMLCMQMVYKHLQTQIAVGTLVSSQERRALFVLRIYRGKTAGFVTPSVLNTN